MITPAEMTPAHWRAAGQTLDLDGRRIFTIAFGPETAPPVLALHGFPTSSYDYVRIAPLLAGDFRLILLDFFGFGFSGKPREHTYSLFEQAELAEAAAAAYGASSVRLLAHDMGDSVALEVLRRGRLPVSHLALMNGSVLLRHYRPLPIQRALLHRQIGPLITRLGLVRERAFAQQFRQLFAQSPADDTLHAFWSLIADGDGPRIYHKLIGYLRERQVHELAWLDALAQHRAPLLVVWGLRDPVSVPAIADEIAARRPDAHMVRLPAVGHFPHWEAPETTARWIIEHFR